MLRKILKFFFIVVLLLLLACFSVFITLFFRISLLYSPAIFILIILLYFINHWVMKKIRLYLRRRKLSSETRFEGHDEKQLEESLITADFQFAIADPNLETQSSPALQAASLALAGFVSVWSWVYASKNNMINESLSEDDINQITRNNLMEPATAVVNIGLAFVGPMVWTLAWFVLPPVFIWVLNKRNK